MQGFRECILDGGASGPPKAPPSYGGAALRMGGPQIFKVPFLWKNAFFLYKNRHSFRKMALLLEK